MKILGLLEMALVVLAVLLSTQTAMFALLYIPAFLIEIYFDITLDEMMRYYRRRSGVETLYSILFLVMILEIVGMKSSIEVFNLLIVFALLLKNSLVVCYTMNRRNALARIGYTVSALLFLFVLLSHGISLDTLIESVLPLSIFVSTVLALKFRYVGSLAFFSLSALFTTLSLNRGKGIGGLTVFLLLVIPLVVLGFQSLRKE